MKPYRHRGGEAGVVAYDYGVDWIRLQFAGSSRIYEYPRGRIGAVNLGVMKRLADAGRGLTTFVNTRPRVKNGYAR